MKVSLIVVCHRSSEVLPQCVESFRREAGAAGIEAEVVAVEQSEDAAELAQIEGAGVDRLLERPNRGYAAGLNAGVAEATGDVLLLANPDIVFFDGSVDALLRGLRQGFDVVGPQFVWDDEATVLLPAAEDPAPGAELGRTLRRGRRWAWSARLGRSLDETWRVWTARDPLAVAGLRGAVLAASREALGRFGPFDEGYFLYYEETEWLWRARLEGGRLGLAPGARVRHRWGHATRHRDDAVEHEEKSRERFFERNYSGPWRALLGACAADSGRLPFAMARLTDAGDIPERESDLWLASPFPHLMPALGMVRSRGFPPSFLKFCRERRWHLLAADRDGRKWRIADAWAWGA